jgi:hypothetical protein
MDCKHRQLFHFTITFSQASLGKCAGQVGNTSVSHYDCCTRAGALTPKALFGPGSELLASLQQLRSWFETQRSFQFFQVSCLLFNASCQCYHESSLS